MSAVAGNTPATSSGPSTRPTDDNEMLDTDSEGEEPDAVSTESFNDLKRQTRAQARQIQSLMDLVNQMTAQVIAPHAPTTPAPKMAAPEKYGGGRLELPAFLTNMDLYCHRHKVPNDQEKILTANLHMKDEAAIWMQPYVEDYLAHPTSATMKPDTRTLFASWSNFRDEMRRMFGEVDAEDQAEKAITRLKQTKSVSSYTTKFKQLQSRIDWDDAALRTVFENGLKDTIKDALVHHDKPGDLQSLVEMATRIDNRMWERSQQKNKAQPLVANTKKHRRHIRIDREGDVIMTDKVQSKDRKPSGKRQDGLSKEERQKRYDNKACLRCGEVGHFRRDCPKGESTGKQGTVKIGMIRQGTPYPKNVHPSDDDVSDMELYEEAQSLDHERYEMVPRVAQATDLVTTNYEGPAPRTLATQEVSKRLQEGRCWSCGDHQHWAGECLMNKGRVALEGPRAAEIAHQAVREQPYFESASEGEESDVAPKRRQDNPKAEWRTEEHRKLHWSKCQPPCQVHQSKRKSASYRANDEGHNTLSKEECQIYRCKAHQGQSNQATEEQSWADKEAERFEATQEGHYEKIFRNPSPVRHECLHWTFCFEDDCMIHYHAKTAVGYFPKRRPGKRNIKGSKN
jgi:hypothetical protein